MIPGLVTEVPPFSSLQIQHVEGGFLCVTPPAPPVAAKTPDDVAAAVSLFLVNDRHEHRSSATREQRDRPVQRGWGEAKCPQGSVFQASKIKRIDSARGRGTGYMLTYHSAVQGSQHQAVAFDRVVVMERLKLWLTYDPAPNEVESTSSLVTLSGMRPNPDMDMEEERVFRLRVSHASQIKDYTGMTPFVAESDEPRLSVGLVDTDVLTFIVDELNGDMSGEFAARIDDEGWLEFGPRVEATDGE